MKIYLSKAILKNTLNEISINCNSWLMQWNVVASSYVLLRKKKMRSFKGLIQSSIGFFIKPDLSQNKEIYIFEGLKNKDYMVLFKPNSVIIVGSHKEKEFAINHGYGFCWSFPILGAIHAKMTRDWNTPGIRQLNLWVNELHNYDRVVFFLQEDTQPLGTFFVFLGRLLPLIVKTVCIQHGFFLNYYYQIRNDGELSEINFVWKLSQSKIIRCNHSRTFEIGLPYTAIAKPFDQLCVILLGTGMMGSGTSIYERSIKTYLKISNAITKSPGIKIFYRPHPNEYADHGLMDYLSHLFPLVENKDKLAQLRGQQSIFVGVESSMLYEAGVAGHFVCHLKLDGSQPDFDVDLDFHEDEIANLLFWIQSVANGKVKKIINRSLEASPLKRFELALYGSGILETHNKNLH
ncbi:MAG: hypothetical protein K9K84_11130 [Methylovulum sp.]|nr:hypothetical protein [Methylovulum sp.]